MARVQEDKNTVTIRDGSAARTREDDEGVTKCDTLGGACRPHARGMEFEERNFAFLPIVPPARARDGVFDGWGSVLGTDMPTCTRGWGNASLSDSLGRDSRAVRALA